MLNVFNIHEFLLSFGTDVPLSCIRVDSWIRFINMEHRIFQAHRKVVTAVSNWMVVVSDPDVTMAVHYVEWHDNRPSQLLFMALVENLLQIFDHTKLRVTLE